MADQPSETPVLDLLTSMTADSMEASSLDPQTLMLVRIAALVAVDAPPISYLANLGVATEIDIDIDQVRGRPHRGGADRGYGPRGVGDGQDHARARGRDRSRRTRGGGGRNGRLAPTST